MPRGISPFPPQGPPQPEEVTDVVAGRSPEGTGGLSFGDIGRFASRAAGAGQAALQGLRNPQQGGGALGFLGSLGRALPAAYAAGQGDASAAAALNQNRMAQEQYAIQQAKAQQMSQALAGLDPTNPNDVAAMAQIAQQYGDTATAIKLMDMLQSGELARMKAEQEAPKTRQIRDGEDVVHQQWDPRTRTWVEVGRGPVSGGINIDLGENLDKQIYEQVMEDTNGDTFIAKAATENKAFKDPMTGLWAFGDQAEYGKAREYQGYVESLSHFMNLVDELETKVGDTGFVSEGVEGVKAYFGEGSPEYRAFQQARQDLLTQYVKARSGAQVSDKEIGRYEVMFPKYRDMFENGRLKPGSRAMLQGMLEAGLAMGKSRLRYEDRARGEEIFYERLGRTRFADESNDDADRLFREWEAGLKSEKEEQTLEAQAREFVLQHGVDPDDDDDPRVDDLIRDFLAQQK